MTTTMPPSPVASSTEKIEFRLCPDPARMQRLGRADAVHLFASLSDKPYTHVYLGGCALGDGAAAVVADHLCKLAARRSLVSLSLADCIATLTEPEALRTLSILAAAAATCERLISLDLSDNSLGSKGLSACAPLFQHPSCSLQSVTLSRCGLGPDAARLIRSFFTATHAATPLVSLCIDNNLLSSAGVAHLAYVLDKSPLLKHLRLTSLRAGSDAITRVLTSLAAHVTGLETLDLSDNLCDVDAALAFASVCKANTKLRSLMLRDMNLSDDAVYVILRAIVMSPVRLETLDLSSNELTAQSGNPLAHFLEEKAATLTTLVLGDNDFGDNSAGRIASALNSSPAVALRTLSLPNVSLSDLGAVCIASTVCNFDNLERLDIGGNLVRPGVMKAIRNAIGDKLAPSAEGTFEVDGVSEEEGQIDSSDSQKELSAALGRLVVLASTTIQPSTPLGPSAPSQTAFAKVRDLLSIAGSGISRSQSPQAVDSSTDAADFVRTPPAVRRRRVSVDQSSVGERQGMSSPSAMVSSARELRSQVLSLDREVGTLVQELQSRRESLGGASSEYGLSVDGGIAAVDALMQPYSSARPLLAKSVCAELLAFGWACLLAAFLVVIVLGIVQSQDELTFLMRPV
jgi:Ran GTPase-activating protein (RanGAP) involved in mRNA processing and transport